VRISGGNGQALCLGESRAFTEQRKNKEKVTARLLPEEKIWLFPPDILTEKAWLHQENQNACAVLCSNLWL
jgi:hypothetical protein